MIALQTETSPDQSSLTWQAVLLPMIPAIERYARFAFRSMPSQRRDDAIGAVLATCCVAVCRLAERGRLHVARPTVLARFAVCHVSGGRVVGGRLNIHDVLSTYAQRRNQLRVERLSHFDSADGEWREVVVEDRRAGPAETAAVRIDFAAWLKSLPRRNQQIAKVLSTGEQTRDVAKQFNVSPGRVSQLRRELREAWYQFHGEPVPG